jgi:hypothetical protein
MISYLTLAHWLYVAHQLNHILPLEELPQKRNPFMVFLIPLPCDDITFQRTRG